MVCTKCGFTNEAEAKFCASCGAALSAPVVEPAADTYANPADTYTAPVQNPTPAYSAPYQAPVQNYVPAQPVAQPGKGFAIAGMVCGIVSLVCIVPLITGLLGIIFGGVAKSKGFQGGMATAGIACGAIGLGLWVFSVIIAAMGFALGF